MNVEKRHEQIKRRCVYCACCRSGFFVGYSILYKPPSAPAKQAEKIPAALDAVLNRPNPDAAFRRGEYVAVRRVIDGDTIELAWGERVRYIGIDAPDFVHSRKPAECFAREAAAKNRELVEGKEVRLERDISDRDR